MKKEEELSTRKKILNAAKYEFAQKGYAGARTNEIALRAGVNKAMLHYYYKNKDTLYEEVLEYYLKFDKRIELYNYIEKLNISPAAKLYLIVKILFKTTFEANDHDINRLISREIAEKGPKFRLHHKKFFVSRMNIIESIVNEGIAKKEFFVKDPVSFIFAVLSLFLSQPMLLEIYEGTPFYDRFNENKEQLWQMYEKHLLVLLETMRTSDLAIEQIKQKLPSLNKEIMSEIDDKISEILKI